MSIGGEPVNFYNDHFFEKLRETYSITASMLDAEFFRFDTLTKGGGKGGSLMQFTKDQRLLVKALSGDDHASLLAIAESYCSYMMSHRNSLLVRFFFHFYRPEDRKNYVVMNSCMPIGATVDSLWDLKGCADDKALREEGVSVAQVHKRFFMVHWLFAEACACCPCILPHGRRMYKGLKTKARSKVFELEDEDCRMVLESVREDASLLRDKGLMDYSLLVGTLTKPLDPPLKPDDPSSRPVLPSFPPASMERQPFISVRDGKATAFYIGIIDFLQGWTGGKKVAHVIKVLFAPRPISTIEPGAVAYAKQFVAANELRFVVAPPSPPLAPPATSALLAAAEARSRSESSCDGWEENADEQGDEEEGSPRRGEGVGEGGGVGNGEGGHRRGYDEEEEEEQQEGRHDDWRKADKPRYPDPEAPGPLQSDTHRTGAATVPVPLPAVSPVHIRAARASTPSSGSHYVV